MMTQLTRDEHIQWFKNRAFKHLEGNPLSDAVALMISDLNRHPEARKDRHLTKLIWIRISQWNNQGVIAWIESFK